MSAKQFFKSTAFKCIAVLVSIMLICGILLTICNTLFYVSEQEKFERALIKIYGKNVTTEEVSLEGQTTAFDLATVNAAYKVTEDGNYLVKSSGKQGFGGDVTCWVVVLLSGDGRSVTGVGNVVVDSAPGESYLSKIDSSELAQFSQISYSQGFEYELGLGGKDYISTGASYTMRAISNAVNGAISYVNVNVLGQAQEADPLDSFEFTDSINKKSTSFEVVGTTVNYTVVTYGNGEAGSFTLNVSVGEGGVITALTVIVHGSEDGELSKDEYDEIVDVNVAKYNGKDAAYFKGIIGENGTIKSNINYASNELQTGATRSNYLVQYACLFATANYQAALEFAAAAEEGGNAQ